MSNKNTPVISDIKYHFVWHTKHRAEILRNGIRVRARELLREVCSDNGIIVMSGNIGRSYVRMELACPPRLSPSEVMRFLKGRSSKVLQMEYPALKEMRLNDSVWDAGYFCKTFGEVTKEEIRDYIEGSCG